MGWCWCCCFCRRHTQARHATEAGTPGSHPPPYAQPYPTPTALHCHLYLQVQVIDGRIVVNTASLTVQAQEAQAYTRVVTGG
jgi:hypothetical protein